LDGLGKRNDHASIRLHPADFFAILKECDAPLGVRTEGHALPQCDGANEGGRRDRRRQGCRRWLLGRSGEDPGREGADVDRVNDGRRVRGRRVGRRRISRRRVGGRQGGRGERWTRDVAGHGGTCGVGGENAGEKHVIERSHAQPNNAALERAADAPRRPSRRRTSPATTPLERHVEAGRGCMSNIASLHVGRFLSLEHQNRPVCISRGRRRYRYASKSFFIRASGVPGFARRPTPSGPASSMSDWGPFGP